MSNSIARSDRAAFIVASLFVLSLLTLLRFPAVLTGDLIDTDSYMRMVRIEQLIQTGDWFDQTIWRSNAPFGEELHWTRPFDVLVLVPWAILNIVGVDEALYLAGALVSPVLLIFTGFALGWAISPLLKTDARNFVMLGVLGLPSLLSYSLPGRVDHHVLLALLLVLAFGWLLRVILNGGNLRAAIALGALLGAGLWVSVEFLLYIAVFLGIEALAALVWPERFARPAAVTSSVLALTALVATAIERGPEFAAIKYDSVSLAHGIALLVVSIALWAYAVCSVRPRVRVISRWTIGLISLALAGLTINSIFPLLLRNPEEAYDPVIRAKVFAVVMEMQPLWPDDVSDVPNLLVQLGPALLAVAIGLRLSWRIRGTWQSKAWLAASVLLVFHIVLALRALRFTPYAQLLSLPPLIGGLTLLLDRLDRGRSGLRMRLVRIVAIVVVVFGPTLLGAVVQLAIESPAGEEASCVVESLSLALNDHLGDKPRVILGFLDFGPELLYRTENAVVAAPYGHAPGILDVQTVLAGTDQKAAKAVLLARSVDLIVLCPPVDEVFFASPGNTIYNALLAGDEIPGIEPLPLGDIGPFRVFAVHPRTLAQGHEQETQRHHTQ